MFVALRTDTASWRVLDPRDRQCDLADPEHEVAVEVTPVHSRRFAESKAGPHDALELECVDYYGPNQHFSLTTTDDLDRALRCLAAALRESATVESGLGYGEYQR